MRFDRAYVEISNICNLNCSFCPKTKRKPKRMSLSEFEKILIKLRGFVRYLYFHVMGEPLLHPELDGFLKLAKKYGYLVCITTNGTLLSKKADVLISNADVLHRVSISLHAPEGNGEDLSHGEYLDSAISFAKRFAALDKNAVFRLWNLDTDEKCGENSQNKFAEDVLHREYEGPWEKRYSGYKIAYRTFLEYDGIFTWPSESIAEPKDFGKCHALRSQIAILADGTVVPCCLDSEANIPLGNIYESELSEILKTDIAYEMLAGFREGRFVHPFCKTCNYARRFV